MHDFFVEKNSSSVAVSPRGKLHMLTSGQVCAGKLWAAFTRGVGHGLLALDVADAALMADATITYWQNFTRRYLTLVAAEPELEVRDLTEAPLAIALHDADIAQWLLTLPPMVGAEYVNAECLREIWRALESALQVEITEEEKGIAGYFEAGMRAGICLVKSVFTSPKISAIPITPSRFWQLTRIGFPVKGRRNICRLPARLRNIKHSEPCCCACWSQSTRLHKKARF